MHGFLTRADDVLRGRPWTIEAGERRRAILWLGGFVLIFGALYGAAMGTFGGVLGARFLQVLISASKVPVLLLATFLITLPSFFVLNTLFGLRADWGRAMRSVMATQAALTIILAAMAPFTLLWYASVDNYTWAVMFNTIMFAVASVSTQRILRRLYAPLVARNRRHLMLRRAWLVIYAFVGIQMAWILRPFVGSPDLAPQFFRAEAWGNAYVVVIEMIWRAIVG